MSAISIYLSKMPTVHRYLLLCLVAVWHTQAYPTRGQEGRTVVHWRKDDSIFDKTILTKFSTIQVAMRSSLVIECPDRYHTDQSVIYLVTREEAVGCVLGSDAKKIGVCVNPSDSSTIVFRRFSPNPTLYEFTENKEYFLISTSDGTTLGLNQRVGGLCHEHNMRLRLWVTNESDDSTNYKQPLYGLSAPDEDESDADSDAMDGLEDRRMRTMTSYPTTSTNGQADWGKILEGANKPAPVDDVVVSIDLPPRDPWFESEPIHNGLVPRSQHQQQQLRLQQQQQQQHDQRATYSVGLPDSRRDGLQYIADGQHNTIGYSVGYDTETLTSAGCRIGDVGYGQPIRYLAVILLLLLTLAV